MEIRTTSPVSSADSFFFQLIPKYFKVEHGFAKTIKPNTTYRIAIFKGIQRADQMLEPLKSKLVGGKIIFDKTILNFHLLMYSPARNIQFTVRVLQGKPGEEEIAIATCKIKSGDYIKQFKSENVTYNREEVQLMENLGFVFDLFVHTSKSQLQNVVNQHIKKSKIQNRNSLLEKRGNKTPRKNQVSSEILSHSDASQTNSLNRNTGIFASKKKLVRKRGHDGKLKSNRQESQVGSSPSRQSKKSFGHFPHNEQNERFLRSATRLSPPKVEDPQEVQSEVKPSKRENFVTVGRRQIELRNEKGVRNATPLKAGKTTENRDRSQSVKKTQRSNILVIDNPIDIIENTNGISQLHELQINTKQNFFDIRTKNQATSSVIVKIERQKQATPSTASKLTPTKNLFKGTQQSKIAQKKKQSKIEQQQSSIQQPISKPTESNIKNKDKAQNQPSEEQDNFGTKQERKMSVIQIKQKPVAQEGERQMSEKKMRASVRLPTAASFEHEQEQQLSKQYQILKDKLFYLVFVVVSAILFWNAVTPSRKV